MVQQTALRRLRRISVLPCSIAAKNAGGLRRGIGPIVAAPAGKSLKRMLTRKRLNSIRKISRRAAVSEVRDSEGTDRFRFWRRSTAKARTSRQTSPEEGMRSMIQEVRCGVADCRNLAAYEVILYDVYLDNGEVFGGLPSRHQ